MGDSRRNREEKVLRKLVPWLILQLEDELEWLGRPEDADYCSRCLSARSYPPLDAELGGARLKVAVEHTTVDGFPEQRGISARLADLGKAVRHMKTKVPRGNRVTLSVTTDCLCRNNLTRQAVRDQIPDILAKLKEYLARLPENPARKERIRGDWLEDPSLWKFGPLEITVYRFWSPGHGHIRLALAPSRGEWETGLCDCLGKAIGRKVEEKSSSYKAYGSEGWLVVLVVELADFQISSIESAGDAFRQLAHGFDFGGVDGIVLMQDLGAGNEPPECCWAYLHGEVRSREQQHAELCQCLGMAPNV